MWLDRRPRVTILSERRGGSTRAPGVRSAVADDLVADDGADHRADRGIARIATANLVSHHPADHAAGNDGHGRRSMPIRIRFPVPARRGFMVIAIPVVPVLVPAAVVTTIMAIIAVIISLHGFHPDLTV